MKVLLFFIKCPRLYKCTNLLYLIDSFYHASGHCFDLLTVLNQIVHEYVWTSCHFPPYPCSQCWTNCCIVCFSLYSIDFKLWCFLNDFRNRLTIRRAILSFYMIPIIFPANQIKPNIELHFNSWQKTPRFTLGKGKWDGSDRPLCGSFYGTCRLFYQMQQHIRCNQTHCLHTYPSKDFYLIFFLPNFYCPWQI